MSKISDSFRRLEEIINWFSDQEEADVEEGLKKIKEGASIIKELKKKFAEVENEFQEVKDQLKI
jgi:exonuclease VII small subunit